MGCISQKMLMAVAGSLSEYTIANAALFDGANGYMSQSFSSPGNAKLTRYKFFHQREILGAEQCLLCPWISANEYAEITFRSTDKLEVGVVVGGVWVWRITTDMVFRDVRFQDIEVIIDTDQTVYANGVAVLVNGVEVAISSVSGFPASGYDNLWNEAGSVTHYIGRRGNGTADLYGYLAYCNAEDGSITGVSGEVDADTGNWKAKAYDGSYGTNGWELLYETAGLSSLGADLGTDTSGEGNHWTTSASGLSQVTSTPTNPE